MSLNEPRRTTLSPEELESLSQSGKLCEVDSGDVIFERSDQGDRMYLVESGLIELVFENGRPRKSVGPTGFFGELALLFGSHLRSATAVAKEPSRLWELDLETFDSLSDSSPRLLFAVLRRSCASLLESERSLASYLQSQNTELARALQQLQQTERLLNNAEIAAHTDPLTELYNRRYLEMQVGSYLERAALGEIGLVLVLLDVDGFKEINDEHGHAVGDVALQRLAGRLRKNLRRTDLACRIGGDEFAVFMAHDPTQNPARRVGDMFRRITPFDISTPESSVQITASLGGTTFEFGDDWNLFYERADENLYTAKDAGRNRLSWNGEIFEL